MPYLFELYHFPYKIVLNLEIMIPEVAGGSLWVAGVKNNIDKRVGISYTLMSLPIL
jgi:hypothetical protein